MRLLLLVWTLVCLSGCNTSALWAPPPPLPTPLPAPQVRLTFAGSTTVQPLVEQLAVRYRQQAPQIDLDIAAGGSVVGINAVHEGQVDIGMSSRRLRPEEQAGIEQVHIASDVLAVIVNPANPLKSLTLEQLQAIYSGQITNWSALGGPDEPIVPVIREVSSGTRGAFDDIALGGAEPLASADVQVTAGEVEARVARTPSAIGYVGFGNLRADVKVLAIDGVVPSAETARRGSYPLVRPLLLLLGPLSRPEARQFVDFVLSDAGRQVIEKAGWVATAAANQPRRPAS